MMKKLMPCVAALLVTARAIDAGFDFKVPARFERRKLFWVHVPRTGKSLRRHLLHVACPRAHGLLKARTPPRKRDAYVNATYALGPRTRPECAYNFDVDSFYEHVPLPRGAITSHVPILLVREPSRWVVSSFWSGAARPGLSALPGLLRRWPDALVPGAVYKNTRSGRAALLRKSVEALGATPHPLRTYAGLVANCTTKMLLGYPCLGPPRPGLDAGRAVAVVRAAGFVGLTERFADSLLLLKRTFDFDARAPRMPPGSTLERRAGMRAPASAPVWKSTSFSAMIRPSWFGRAVRNRHHHAIEQAYAPEDLKEGLAELKNWRTPDHDVYDVAAQLFDERFRRSGEEILDLVLSLPSRRLTAAFHPPKGATVPPSKTSDVCDFARRAPFQGDVGARAARLVNRVAGANHLVRFDAAAFLAGRRELPPDVVVVERDLKASGARSTTLLYLPTACSLCHLTHVESCWPNALARSTTLKAADVLFYAGCEDTDPVDIWAEAAARLPNKNVSLAWARWNPGHQFGAMTPMVVAARLGWFDAYEWVVRSNPDVTVADASFLEGAMRTETKAVLFTCGTMTGHSVHADFFAASPSAMDNTVWGRGRYYGKVNAEESANMVFQRVIEAGQATLWYGAPGACRVGNNIPPGTTNRGIVHHHRHCTRHVGGQHGKEVAAWVRERARTPLAECTSMLETHKVKPMFSWGTLDKIGQRRWKRLVCEDEFSKAAEQATCPGGASRPTIKVLVWNRINGYLNWLEPDTIRRAKCECSTECRFVSRREELATADGVVFHAATHHKDPPLFPPQRRPNQKYALVSLEQPGYVPRLTDQNYVSRFDYVMTYDLDTTIPMLTIPQMYNASRYFERGKPWELRKDAVAVFVSNCRNAGASKRLAFLEALSKAYPVHSYGRCLHNRDAKQRGGEERGAFKRRILGDYKFALAMENAVVKDYVSEKVFDALLAGALPLYDGAPRVSRLLPDEGAVLKTADFPDVSALAATLRRLAAGPEPTEHFRWRARADRAPAFQRVLDMSAHKYTALCRVCERLQADKKAR